LTEVSYDQLKSEAAKQDAKNAEIVAIEAYKKTHAQNLIQSGQLCANNATGSCINGSSRLIGFVGLIL